jgi:hypothetical protein
VIAPYKAKLKALYLKAYNNTQDTMESTMKAVMAGSINPEGLRQHFIDMAGGCYKASLIQRWAIYNRIKDGKDRWATYPDGEERTPIIYDIHAITKERLIQYWCFQDIVNAFKEAVRTGNDWFYDTQDFCHRRFSDLPYNSWDGGNEEILECLLKNEESETEWSSDEEDEEEQQEEQEEFISELPELSKEDLEEVEVKLTRRTLDDIKWFVDDITGDVYGKEGEELHDEPLGRMSVKHNFSKWLRRPDCLVKDL